MSSLFIMSIFEISTIANRVAFKMFITLTNGFAVINDNRSLQIAD